MVPTTVLFDFDGVLADAENYHVAAWQRTLVRMGWELSDESASPSAGMDDREFAAGLFEKRGIADADLDGWVRTKRELTLQMIQLHPRTFPGAVDLVRASAARVKVAVVSTTWREGVEAFLQAVGLTDAVTTVVGREDAASAKADLDPRLVALKRMRVAASRAVCVEGSPEGLAAAEAAGIARVAVGHRRNAGDWSGDAPFLASFESLADALDRLGIADRKPR